MTAKTTDRANRENQAMRNAFALMGFDVDRLIQFMGDNEQGQWTKAMFSGVRVQFDLDKAQQSGVSERTIESLRAILNGLRIPEGNHV